MRGAARSIGIPLVGGTGSPIASVNPQSATPRDVRNESPIPKSICYPRFFKMCPCARGSRGEKCGSSTGDQERHESKQPEHDEVNGSRQRIPIRVVLAYRHAPKP